jgi:polyisoprenoid-binding protein YceI
MSKRNVLLSVSAFASLLLTAPAAGAAGQSHKVDPVHSTVLFKIQHFGAGNFYGRFNDASGTIVLDPKEPGKSTVELQVKADSIDTANEKRDQHVKGPDFFNVKQFPLITFKGKDLKKTGDTKYEVTGDLTLHGVTKEVKIQAEQVGSGKGMGGEIRTGFEATFKLKRSDFGMKFMVGPVGDEVQIIASLECTTGGS